MNRLDMIRGGIELLFYSGAARLLTPLCRGIGAVFMLHHVRPGGGQQRGFAPNQSLEITPDFLNRVIEHLRSLGYEFASVAQAVERIREGRGQRQRPFVAFAIDDGNRDILVHAWPVFRKHACPFTIFVAPAITDGTCELWWRGLEAVIAGEPHMSITVGGRRFDMPTATDAQKSAAWHRLYWVVRTMGEYEQRQFIRALCSDRGIDLNAICRAEAMTWDELKAIASDPLCSIGAHTINHFALGGLPIADAEAEMRGSAERITAMLGVRPRWFAYPYGDRIAASQREFELARNAGFEAAFTTRRGLIHGAHGNSLMALPRISLNGLFQNLRYVDVMLSGAPSAIFNGFRRVVTV